MPSKKNIPEIKVLILDDVRTIANSIREALIKVNFSPRNITICSSLEEAEKQYKRSLEKPECMFNFMIIDLNLYDDIWGGVNFIKFVNGIKKIKKYNEMSYPILYSNNKLIYSRYIGPESDFDSPYPIEDLKKLVIQLKAFEKDESIRGSLQKKENHEALISKILQMVEQNNQ